MSFCVDLYRGDELHAHSVGVIGSISLRHVRTGCPFVSV